MANFEVSLGVDKVNDFSGNFKPGHVISYIGSTIPNGWLLCDGRAVSRSIYSNLWNAVRGSGSTGIYGNGDGSATFNLPNFSNRFVYIGTVGSGGSDTHTHTINATATAGVTGINHTHSNFETGLDGPGNYATGQGGALQNNHNHSGDANIGYNGTNPVNANKTGTGGSGVANGGAHLHGAYSAAGTDQPRNDRHGHNIASFGLNAHYSEHGSPANTYANSLNGTHTSAITATSSSSSQAMPYYAVYFLVKI